MFWKKIEEEQRGREDSAGFKQDARGYAPADSRNRKLLVRHSAGDTYILWSSIAVASVLQVPVHSNTLTGVYTHPDL